MNIDLIYWILRFFIHYSFHFILPFLITYLFYNKNWKKFGFIMVLTILIDLDHILAYPDIFVDGRKSVGFHVLHSYYAIIFYFILFFIKKFRILSLGLLLHITTDILDYFLYILQSDILNAFILLFGNR